MLVGNSAYIPTISVDTLVIAGGGSTQKLWAGYEFGSNRLRQFPRRTPSKGRGNAGYFIYPTLRKIQPELIKKWQEAFSKILKEWDK